MVVVSPSEAAMWTLMGRSQWTVTLQIAGQDREQVCIQAGREGISDDNRFISEVDYKIKGNVQVCQYKTVSVKVS